MRYATLLFLIPICLLFAGCNKQTGHNANEASEFYTIDFEQGFDTERQMFISEIADSVEYIELKTPDDVIITRIWDIKHVDDYLVVRASLYAYLFHKNGQFIKRIGNVGQGPGEYIVACDVEIDFKKKEIIIADVQKLLFYDLNGNFLRSRQLKDLVLHIGLSDSILWVGQKINSAQQKDMAIAISSVGEGDTVAYLPNPLYNVINTGNTGFSGSPFTRMFYHKDDLLYFSGNESNDTIWKISGANAKPHAFIDMGKYKMPVEFEPWNTSHDTYMKNCGRYWGISSLVEDNRYFFLSAHNRKFKDKDNPTVNYIVYDKETKESFTAKDENGMGMTDDILGGPPVWPRWISDDYYINAVESYILLDKIEAGEYTPSPQLQELLSGIDEYANPVIILCHRKK